MRRAQLPVPLSVTVWGDVGSASVMVRVPVRVPVAWGVNVTVIVQLVPPAIEAPQVLVCWKSKGSAPVTAMELRDTGADPRFVTVTVLPVLVLPTFVDGKLNVFAETVIA